MKQGTDAVQVIVMCKAPVAGRVKTRLSPVYSAEEACTIHKAMAKTVIDRASTIFSKVYIAADDVSHPFFKQFELPVIAQGEGDLGARMARLMVGAFDDGAEAVLFLGTDSPHMTESRLVDAVGMLNSFDAVVGPVEDGGYDLIAMRRPASELFDDIRWSSEYVLQETLARANAAGISVGQLDVGFDLDTPESLQRVGELWSAAI